MVQVAHVRKSAFDVYIGRQFAEFAHSPFCNPFHVGKHGSRTDVLLLFAEYWYAPEQKTLRNMAVLNLSSKTLGCWCKPLPCHGDIIAGYVEAKTHFFGTLLGEKVDYLDLSSIPVRTDI